MTDTEYHLRRETQERRASAVAADPGARYVHLQLARRHAARALGPETPRLA